MANPVVLRGVALLVGGLLVAGCAQNVEVDFAQPFPARAADMMAFQARYQAVYKDVDSTSSLCVGRTAVWRQELRSRQQPISPPLKLRADSTYRSDEGVLHYLQVVGKDSVRDSWLWQDTIFTLTGEGAGRLRRYKGRYYLNTPKTDASGWRVQRLTIANRQLTWQTFGRDTLRLQALDPATVRYHRKSATSYYQLTPAPGAQTRRVARYDGLWDTEQEYVRRH